MGFCFLLTNNEVQDLQVTYFLSHSLLVSRLAGKEKEARWGMEKKGSPEAEHYQERGEEGWGNWGCEKPEERMVIVYWEWVTGLESSEMGHKHILWLTRRNITHIWWFKKRNVTWLTDSIFWDLWLESNSLYFNYFGFLTIKC